MNGGGRCSFGALIRERILPTSIWKYGRWRRQSSLRILEPSTVGQMLHGPPAVGKTAAARQSQEEKEKPTMPGRHRMPQTIKKSPKRAQRIYTKTLENAEKEYGDDRRAHQTAFAAVKREFKKADDRWEPKEGEGRRRTTRRSSESRKSTSSRTSSSRRAKSPAARPRDSARRQSRDSSRRKSRRASRQPAKAGK